MATHKHSGWIRPAWMTATLACSIGAVIAAAALFAPQPAQAIHDDANTPFALDGDPTDTSALLDDWDSVFALGSPPYATPRLLPTVAAGDTFVVDSQDPDVTAFTSSNKDIDQVNTWNWGTKGLSPPKDDITNAYAKAYHVAGFPANDIPGHPNVPHEHLVVYFGADRFADDGDAAMGFWFFRNDVGLGGNGKFTGTHAVGDVLIQIDYRGAGSNEIEVFKWVGTGGNAGGGKLQRLAIGTSNNPADTICTASNGAQNIPADSACITTNIVQRSSPWAYTPKGSDSVGPNTFPPRVFMEGGFDVTSLVGNVCFSDFMAETRSSHSETASLKDFALGAFDLCSINVEKICVADSQTVDPATAKFTTTHTVTITNDGFGGSLRDVEIADPLAVSGNTCEIKSLAVNPAVPGGATLNGSAVGFKFDSAGDSVEVADVLGGEISVELECVSGENPFRNSVDVKARAAVGAPQDITDTDLETTVEAGVCELALDSGLALKKWCQGDDGQAVGHPMGPNPYYGVPDSENPLELGVFLKPPNYIPQVCVDIQLSNTSSNQSMVVDTFSDSDLGNLVPAGGITLGPLNSATDSYVVSRCYTPSAPDGAVGDPIDPSTATYSDTVSATGHGKIDNATANAGPVTATCELCPPHAH
ncbi:hypothetical protein LYSHEL_14540 [Lysobacter helvus]|uniref:DUF11 domain-containing protein n=2 Tax=Lysobacteraceae TaxID=32033 RepID=A0ABN6FU11_9GAMM|nr:MULTISPECIES: hypothetical protein [Lysobacter]BCT92430.1 hypothetical protein LYSCAS_14540 [Lysobacter caseinilyticus]BCT95583.1 hypothetical protein LYSHEL_14540 [Lysobacter helvus]